MQRPGVDRILVLTGICLVTIFLAFRLLAFNAVSSKELGQVIVIGVESGSQDAPDPFDRLETVAMARDSLALLEVESRSLEFTPTIFFSDTDIAAWQERKSARDLYQEISPPLALSSHRREDGVLLTWEPNPRNDAIAGLAADNPLLKTGYRIYRWRIGEEPAVIATGPLKQTSLVDDDLGIRGGLVFYSVLTVLEGRIGEIETLIESERSEVLEVDLEDAFGVRLLGYADGASDADGPRGPHAEDARVRIEVSLPSVQHVFDVAAGETLGDLVEIDGRTVDLGTGLVIESVALIEDEQDETIRHPVFNPDGSRAFDETGFLFQEETRRIPIQRLEVRCAGDRGKTRILSTVRP